MKKLIFVEVHNFTYLKIYFQIFGFLTLKK